MKRQIFSILLLAGAMVFGMSQLNANCTGTSEDLPLAVCGEAEEAQARAEAVFNCCGGSIIYVENYCNSLPPFSIFVMHDGLFSSFAIE